MSLEQAIKTLIEAGAVFTVSTHEHHLSLGEAGRRLDCSAKWVRTHIDEFPGAWRMPGGELRIPARDVTALAAKTPLRRDLK
jgi:hypothetical protein